VAVASDPTNGPLIAVLTTGGAVYAKEGLLAPTWYDEYNGTEVEPYALAVASDPTNGPLIGVVDASNTAWAKEGSLTAPWVEEYDGGSIWGVAVAG
jgi:hypothetical protein